MNNDSFFRYIENNRDCTTAALDEAVSRGIFRARNDRFDSMKLIALGAACAFVLAMSFTVSLNLFEPLAENYYRSRHYIMPGTAEALDGYIKDIAVYAQQYFGGL